MQELLVAGGSLALVGCGGSGGSIPACNANPDPCCSQPKSEACLIYAGCRDAGGYVVTNLPLDAGVTAECVVPDMALEALDY